METFSSAPSSLQCLRERGFSLLVLYRSVLH